MKKILIINTNRNHFPLPVIPIGACMTAQAAEEAGYQVNLLDLTFDKDPLRRVYEQVSAFEPHFVGLSIRNIDNHNIQDPYSFAAELKAIMQIITTESPAPVIIGGAAVCIMPEELLKLTGAEWAVTGDGETIFPVLIRKLSNDENPKEVPGVAWLEEGRLQGSPPAVPFQKGCWSPDYPRWIETKEYLQRLASIPLQTKLGCHFQCVYCTYRKIDGGPYCLSDPAQVASVVQSLERQGFRDIEFVDNVFNYPYGHALAVCEAIAGQRGRARLHTVELSPLELDTALLKEMKRAGFSGIGVTAESASEAVLEGLGKGFGPGDVCQAAEAVRRSDIPCLWIFMLGGPGETKQTVAETLKFARQEIRKADVAFFGVGVRIYPGTRLEAIARSQGLLDKSRSAMLEPVFYLCPEVGLDWITKELRKAMDHNMNFIGHESLGFPLLPAIERWAYRIGLRPPLWRHTRPIRRGLRILGMEA